MPIVAVLRERIVVQHFGTSIVELRPYIVIDAYHDLGDCFEPRFYVETWRDKVLHYVADLMETRRRLPFARLRDLAKTLAPRG